MKKRTDIEILANGTTIDWSQSIVVSTLSGHQNFQRKIFVSCSTCGEYRYINSCALSQVRLGKQASCWECHKIKLGKKNSTNVKGRHRNKHGYIVRTLASFTPEELVFLQPMFRRGGRKKATEILEHRALYALHHKVTFDSKQIIHHKNGIKDDNRIENLELISLSAHTKEHKQLLNINAELHLKIQELESKLKGLQNAK
jgi:hypothetical protein